MEGKEKGGREQQIEKKLQPAQDKEVSVVENTESDIKVMQFNLLTLEPEMHG